MDQKVVQQLEAEIAAAVDGVIARLDPRQLPLRPSRRTVHLMAKSAVAVYEAAVENHRERPDE
jgi:hypothetical protein